MLGGDTEEVEPSATTYKKTPKKNKNKKKPKKKLFVQAKGDVGNQSGYSDSDSDSDSDSAPDCPTSPVRPAQQHRENTAPSYVDKPLTQQRK